MLINSLVCWLLYVESVSHRIGLWWLIVYYNHWNGLLTLILYPFEKSSAIERSQNDLTIILLLDVLRDRYLSPWCSSWPLSFSLMFFLTAIFHLDVLLDRCLSPWCSSWPLSFSLMFCLTAFSLMFLLTTIFLLDVPLGFSFSLFHWFCVLLYLVWLMCMLQVWVVPLCWCFC